MLRRGTDERAARERLVDSTVPGRAPMIARPVPTEFPPPDDRHGGGPDPDEVRATAGDAPARSFAADPAGPVVLRAECLPGLERLLVDELRGLGLAGGDAGSAITAGAVEWSGTARDAAVAQRGSAIASRLTLCLARFRAREFAVLRGRAERIAWSDWLGDGDAVSVDARSRKSRLYHTGAIAERIAAAIVARVDGVRIVSEADTRADAVRDDGPGAAGAGGEPPSWCVRVRIEHDVVTLALDLVGSPLHRRGYRLQTAKAPLREDLAAALLRAVGWRPGRTLFDPFAGSGTIVIEAARQAAGIAPGAGRRVAAERWPAFRAAVDELDHGDRPWLAAAPTPIFASDRDAGAVEILRANAERAGVADRLVVECAAFSAASAWQRSRADGVATLATNPPFGRRIGGGRDLRPLYQRLGRLIEQHGAASLDVALLAHDARLARSTALALQTRFVTRHGGLSVRAMVRESLDAMTNRPTAAVHREPDGSRSPRKGAL